MPMTWTVPDVDRVDEPFDGDERAMLQGFLDFGRKTLLLKCCGLAGDALARRPIEPSTLSLLGLIRHVTEVERTWFRRRFGGEDVAGPYRRDDQPDAAFHDVDPTRAEQDIACLVAEWHAADRAVACLRLDHTFVSDRWGEMTLRWAYSHMISEYSRHSGHADLLRQRIDGVIGT
jgi:hypothetical protein